MARQITCECGHTVRGETEDEVVDLAAHCGVADQLEIHELVDHERVNQLLNRARVSLVWSRREGINRAVVESMFAGVPCLLRD